MSPTLPCQIHDKHTLLEMDFSSHLTPEASSLMQYSKEKSILAKQINVSVYVSVKTNFCGQHRLNLNYLRLQHDMTKNYQNYFLWLLNFVVSENHQMIAAFL